MGPCKAMNLNQLSTEILRALYIAFAMLWEILWPLILGFALSGTVQAVVSKREMSRQIAVRLIQHAQAKEMPLYTTRKSNLWAETA